MQHAFGGCQSLWQSAEGAESGGISQCELQLFVAEVFQLLDDEDAKHLFGGECGAPTVRSLPLAHQTSIYCLHSVASVVEHLAHQLVFKGMRLIDPALEQGQLRLKHLTHRFSSLE
ncbi:MAG: hypothetical protein BWY17_04709 [Deltaproteobacteria bacterium ADurb.Bin207]|nr:MAG: hypothetical protein BWY17_04709 [Deltaproteobacteria bacterium ADurb.Bin207]